MEKKPEGQLGIINEIGDLGLGFEPILEEDAEKLKDKEEEDK